MPKKANLVVYIDGIQRYKPTNEYYLYFTTGQLLSKLCIEITEEDAQRVISKYSLHEHKGGVYDTYTTDPNWKSLEQQLKERAAAAKQ